MYTEAEAKEKLCAVRLSGQWNGPDGDRRGFVCEASGCMMWRWQYDRATVNEFDRDKYRAEGFHVVSVRPGAVVPLFTMVRKTEHGFCGLAGVEVRAPHE